MPFDRNSISDRLRRLAESGIWIGTSSWKYPGWCGKLYNPSRYEWRGRMAQSRFERGCLAEYAEVFQTVCVDAAYYTFPSESYLTGLASQVPPGFRFAFKVTDAITLKKFPNLDRFGDRAGKPNEHFLDPDLFTRAFLAPCAAIRSQIGILIFEFSRFYPTDYAHGKDFIADLDRFLGGLPVGWPYGIEIRNRHFLHPEYFSCLSRHHVAHVFNSWDAMPGVSDQMKLEGSRPNPGLSAARFLLTPGRKYESAVKAFQPYDRIREIHEDSRKAAADLVREALCQEGRKTYIYVNNRLEGNALETIAAVIEQLGALY